MSFMLSVTLSRYAECRYSECRDALKEDIHSAFQHGKSLDERTELRMVVINFIPQ
jgi:hypothetical protein